MELRRDRAIDPWTGTLLHLLPPYTGVARRRQGQPRLRGVDLVRRGVPDARVLPVNDDWVDLKQQVKDASDIVEVVGGYIPLKPAGPTFKGLCPFHDDQRPSFDVDPRRQRYRCWACNKYGDVFSFVMEHERVSFVEAMELLARRAGISLEKVRKNSTGPNRAAMFDVMRWAQEQFQECLLDAPIAQAARNYLDERGLEDETIRQFGLGFAPPLGEWLVAKAANKGFATE